MTLVGPNGLEFTGLFAENMLEEEDYGVERLILPFSRPQAAG